MYELNEDKLKAVIGFEPHENQLKILDNMKRFTCITAGRRFGKTLVASYLAMKYLCLPRKTVWVVAPCVDVETEIFTKRGWLTHEKLKRSDVLLTINKNGDAEWQKCQKISRYPYTGKMIKMKSRGHDSLTTPHHRWLVGYASGNRKNVSGYRFTNSASLTKSNEFIPCSANVINLPKRKTYSDSIVELVAWYYTEGSVNGSGINISQNKGCKANRIRNALIQEFGEPQARGNNMRVFRAGWTDWRKQSRDPKNINGLFYLNRVAANKLKALAPNKVPSDKFINRLTLKQLKLFVNVSLMADGHSRRDGMDRVFIQKRKEVIDALQKAVQLSGEQSCLKFSKSRRMYELQIFKRNRLWAGQKCYKKNKSIVDYEGVVWCPKTKNGTWLARRNGTVYFTGNTYDLAKKTWRYIYGWVLREFPNMKINQSTLTIECPETESILELKTAENPASCIGSGVDFLIVDEASRVKETVWQEALYPTLSDKQGKAFMISTPKGKNWFYELYVKGLEDQYEEYQSFSFETKDNTALPHLTEEQEKARKNLPENIYQQEYEAKFLEDAGQVFRNIKACVWGDFEEPNPEKAYVLGVDLAKYEDYTVLTVLDLTTFHVVYYERFNKIDWEFQRKKIKQISTRYHKCPITIDSTGVGDPIAEQLEREGYVIEQYKYTNASKKFLIENLALKIQQREVTFPEIPELIHELEVFGYEYSPSGNITYNAPEGFHDDCVNSLALAVHGAGHFKRDPRAIKRPYPAGSFGYITEQIDRKQEEKELESFI